MKYHKIVYTYSKKGIQDEQEMIIGGVSLTEALTRVGSMAHTSCLEDFRIRKVYIETEDKTGWTEVPDWDD